MSQKVVYITMDTIPADAQGVVGNSGSVPTITNTTTVALTYDPATININQLQMAVEAFMQFVNQDCDSAEALGTTYRPVGAQA